MTWPVNPAVGGSDRGDVAATTGLVLLALFSLPRQSGPMVVGRSDATLAAARARASSDPADPRADAPEHPDRLTARGGRTRAIDLDDVAHLIPTARDSPVTGLSSPISPPQAAPTSARLDRVEPGAEHQTH